jgi:hypothetical protein
MGAERRWIPPVLVDTIVLKGFGVSLYGADVIVVGKGQKSVGERY